VINRSSKVCKRSVNKSFLPGCPLKFPRKERGKNERDRSGSAAKDDLGEDDDGGRCGEEREQEAGGADNGGARYTTNPLFASPVNSPVVSSSPLIEANRPREIATFPFASSFIAFAPRPLNLSMP
jgi:hypothetical protein